jgi:2-keto-4-pentenoate hydratase
MRSLLARREDELRGGAQSVGWKVGINVAALQEHFGLDGPVVGYLTDATVIEPGQPISLNGWDRPALEVEVAITIGADGGVASLAPAIELVDLNLGFDDIGPILEGNIFHRGVLFGAEMTNLDVRALGVSVEKSGERVAEGSLTELPEVTVEVVRGFLRAHGADLVPGDRIIAGSLISPMGIAAGDDLLVSYGPLGDLRVSFI